MKLLSNTRYLVLIIVATTIAFIASAGIPPRPKNANELVYDYANVIDSANFQAISDSLKALQAYNRAQVVVLTVKSLDGMELEDYSLAVLRSWGIGDKEKNNGVLILVKPKTGDGPSEKGKVRIETGYGAEGVLPDVLCKQLQTDSMIPAFKKGDYGLAIRRAVNAIVPSMKGEYPAEISSFLEDKKSDSRTAAILYGILYILVCGLIWYFCFMPINKDWYSIIASPLLAATTTSSSRRRGSYSSGSSYSGNSSSRSSWSSGSSSSSYSWGGGSGGGGGASSSW